MTEDDEGARQGPSDNFTDRSPQSSGQHDASTTAEPWWTEADAAELDVLVYELARGYFEHRERCEACRPGDCSIYLFWHRHLESCKACQGDAPLTFGPPCPRRREFIEHGNTCPRCNPCPVVVRAIAIVGDWMDTRELWSRAEWLRAERDRLEQTA